MKRILATDGTDVPQYKNSDSVPSVKSVAKNRRRSADEALVDGKPWGYDVLIYFNNGNPAKIFHKQGTEKDVHRWAVLKRNHASHSISSAYTRKEWLACFGDGKQRM